MRLLKGGLWLSLVATLALFVGVNTAGAATVPFGQGCYQGTGATTTPGPLRFQYGWAVLDQPRLDKFLRVQSQTWSVTVDGVTTTGSTSQGSTAGWVVQPPRTNGDGNTVYPVQYTSPVIADLTDGQTAQLHFVLSVKNRVYDDSAQKIGYGPGAIITIDCSIQARSS